MSQITSHIEIKVDNCCTKAYIDGVQLRGLTKIEFEQSVDDMLPKLVFTVNKGEYLGTSMSDEDGIADFNLDLCAGRYVIKEIKAPEGYSINTDTFIFEFVKDKSNRDYIETIEVYDKKNPGKTKGKLVKGATETKVTKNNYRTEDIGTNGYSILLKRDDKRKGIILIIIGSLTVSTGILILLSALLKMIRRR